MRILVVDDVGYVRHYFDRLLTQNGHTVWTAASGFKALEVLQEQNAIEVVITDLLMPGMDGLELIQAAKKLPRYAAAEKTSLPVFYLITALRPTPATSNRETNLLQQALQLGFAEVLLKPIDNQHLLGQLANLERANRERKSVSNEPGVYSVTTTNHDELLHALDQNIERLLCCEDRTSLAELAKLLNATLARIPPIIRQLEAQSQAKSTSPRQTLPALSSGDEPALSPAGGFVAENGLSIERQT